MIITIQLSMCQVADVKTVINYMHKNILVDWNYYISRFNHEHIYNSVNIDEILVYFWNV